MDYGGRVNVMDVITQHWMFIFCRLTIISGKLTKRGVNSQGVHCILCLRITCDHDSAKKPLVYERLYV